MRTRPRHVAGRATLAGLIAGALLVTWPATGEPAAAAPCFGPFGEAGRDSLLATMSSNGRFVAYHAKFRSFSGVMVRDLRLGTLCRVDLDANGQPVPPGPDVVSDRPAISADGRYVAFVSHSPLVAGDTNAATDLFVRDRQRSITVRVDLSSTARQLGGGLQGGSPAISADGRFIAFTSAAADVVPGDTNGHADVFLRDTVAGSTRRVSVGPGGAQSDGDASAPAIGANGRYVAFTSTATNLPSAAGCGAGSYVRDVWLATTVRIDIPPGRPPHDCRSSRSAALSPDGRYVAFDSDAPDLVPGDTNSVSDVFVRELRRGTIRRVSISTGGGEADAGSDQPALSAGARLVAFTSTATNLAPAGPGGSARAVFVRDLATSRTTRITPAVSPGSSGAPFISADGRYVAFTISGSDAVPGTCVDRTNAIVADLRLHSYQTASSWCEGR